MLCFPIVATQMADFAREPLLSPKISLALTNGASPLPTPHPQKGAGPTRERGIHLPPSVYPAVGQAIFISVILIILPVRPRPIRELAL